MKIKVEKKGKKKTYNLIKSWKDVTLEKWVKLIAFEKLSSTQETLEVLSVLTDMPKKLIRELAIQDVANIMSKINDLQADKKVTLKKIIEVDGKEYGFHPNLGQDLTLGEWADIETMIEQGLEDNMHNIMAILFRPILERENEAYIIAAYDGNIDVRAEKFKKMSAEQVQSALVFFYRFVNALSTSILLSLQERLKENPKQ
jgi:hypothetical protein|tara:strand:- start:6082 stop:6684 length:603 start_codon:yes stop_codon:yes gene_type:complete